MLSPEVCRFPAPRVTRSVLLGAQSADVASAARTHLYYHTIAVVCPDEYKLPDSLLDVVSRDSDFYELSSCPARELINKQFVEHFIANGNTSALSVNAHCDIDNCLAITEDGILVLHIVNQLCQELGLEGTKSSKNFSDIPLKMPNIRKPKRLDDMAIQGLGDWVAQQAENMMTPITNLSQQDSKNARYLLGCKVNQIRSFLLYNVPWMLYDTLFEQVIRAISTLLEKTKHSLGFRGSMANFVNQMNTAVTMSEVLLTPYITKICIDEIPKMMRSVFYVKLDKLVGLRHLNLGSLSGGWKTIDMEPAIIKALSPLSRLKYLCINYDCTDNILHCITNSCPVLEALDLSCSKSITNDSIDIITRLKFLKSIQLYRTSVSIEGFTMLLLKCKNLEDIGRCDEIGRILEFIHLTNSYAGPFGLRTFVSRYNSVTQLQLTVELCPRICKMTVFHNTLQGDLTTLMGLPELSDLKLLSCDFFADQVKQVLQVKGCNIVSLHLEHVDQIDMNALMYISQMCPVLENFTLYNCTLIQHTSLYTKKLEILPFRNLKRLTCVAECTEEQILFIMTNCLNVQFVHFGTAMQLTDRVIELILDKNPLLQLEELRVMQADFLTMSTVDRLINNCMNLRILVELECWSLLTDSDREYVKNYIKLNNLDIDVSPIRRYDA